MTFLKAYKATFTELVSSQASFDFCGMHRMFEQGVLVGRDERAKPSHILPTTTHHI